MNSATAWILSPAGKARKQVAQAVEREIYRRCPDLPKKRPLEYWSEGRRAFRALTGVSVDIGQIASSFHLFDRPLQDAVIQLIGDDHSALPTALSDDPSWISDDKQKEQLLASASAFRMAVDALPVGRDIRSRLLLRLDDHIRAIEAMR